MQHSYRIWRVWIWEILALVLTAGLIIAIAVILAWYNGKPVTDWTVRINLNALLALLSTILRAMLVVIVSQIISQRKWEWYKIADARPLSDLHKFDSGSRGSFGALLLIPTVLRKDIVTAVAAAVLIVSFLVGPFVQLASRTNECSFPVPGQEASLPFAHFVPRKDGYIVASLGGLSSPTADAVVAILSSATAPDGVENQISPSCATGNCTFPDGDPGEDSADSSATTFSTVGVCSGCVNAESLVIHYKNYTERDDVLGLPNGFNLAGRAISLIRPSFDLDWLGNLLTPEQSALSRWAYVNTTFLARSTDGRPTAAVCSLYPCLRTYTASVDKSKLSEKLIRSEIMELDMTNKSPRDVEYTNTRRTLTNSLYYYTKVKSPCRADGEIYDLSKGIPSNPKGTKLALFDFTRTSASTPSEPTYQNITVPEQCIYRNDPKFATAISNVLNYELFSGKCTVTKRFSCTKIDLQRPNETAVGFGSNAGVETILRNFYNDGDGVTFSNLSHWFDSFANAMTNRFRFEYGSSNFTINRENLAPGTVQGLAWQTATCFSMHKGWLALPICLALITTILSVWTIASNWRNRHRRPVWKDNILPLIFYGHKIKSQESETLLDQRTKDASDDDRVYTPEEEKNLLEAREMEAVGRDRLVTFQWPDMKDSSSIESIDSSTNSLQQKKNWFKRRRL